MGNNPNVFNSAAGGVGITLASGVDIQRVNAGVTGAVSTTGISGTAITTATIGPNQLVQGNATGVSLTGAAGGNITVAADITGNTGNAVNVANRSSGTVTFSGQVTGSATNAGATLTSNTGATIAFTGPINLAGSGPAGATFRASGGGTITATNAINQITSFTGTGVNLNGVTIGAAGFTLNTVSSAPAGAAIGISLTERRRTRHVHRQRRIDHRHHPRTRRRRQQRQRHHRRHAHHLRHLGAIRRGDQPRRRHRRHQRPRHRHLPGHQPDHQRHRHHPLRRRHHRQHTGTNTAFNATGGGTIAVTATNAVNQITGFTGTGINLNAVTIGADGVTFNTVSTGAGGAAIGIVLMNVAGPGTFTVNGGSITATIRALDVDGNIGNVTIGATLTTSGTAARSVEVTNRDGGTVDINGLVTESSLGINLSTNGTGLVRFDGGINASTGANPAFVSAVSGSVAVTDTNGTTAPNNTLTTTTGTSAQRRQHDDPCRRPDVPEHLRQRRNQRHHPQQHRDDRRTHRHGDRSGRIRRDDSEHLYSGRQFHQRREHLLDRHELHECQHDRWRHLGRDHRRQHGRERPRCSCKE